jgi:hypothetical protein
VERALAYVGNLSLGSTIVYVVNPEPLISGWGVFIVSIVLIGTCVAGSAIRNWAPRSSNETLLKEWSKDVDLPRVENWASWVSWVRPLNPEKEFNSEMERYRANFLDAKRKREYLEIDLTVSIVFIELGVVIYVVASRGWQTLFLLAGALVVGAIIHQIISGLGYANSTGIVLVFASLSAACYLVGRQQGSPLDLHLLNLDSLPFSGQLLSIGVDAPLILISILVLAAAPGGYFESVELRIELEFGRACAVKALIGAIHKVSRELTWPSSDNRSEVARRLRDAAYFVRYGLVTSVSSPSTSFEREQRLVYQRASHLLQKWAEEASFPSAATYDSLRSSLYDFLEILMTECDCDLPQLEPEEAPVAESRRRNLRVLRHQGGYHRRCSWRLPRGSKTREPSFT